LLDGLGEEDILRALGSSADAKQDEQRGMP